MQDFDRTNIIPGSLSYNTTLSGTYTGGYFTYTDADKDLDIVCSVGGGNHTKNVNRRATSVFDASVQLCAEINNANHGRVKLKFSVMGNWGVSAGNNLRLTGYGDGLNGGINGKYFVDKVTHKYTKSGGFVTSFECSGIFDPFHYWDVGGHIEYHQSEDSSSESYNSAYETTSPAANAASAAAGATAGAAVTLCCAVALLQLAGLDPLGLFPGDLTYYDSGVRYSGTYLGTIGNTNILDAVLCLAVPVFAVSAARERALRWLFLPLALSLAVLALAGGDGAYLALGSTVLAALVFLPRTARGRRFGLLAAFGLTAAAVCAVWLYPGESGTLHELRCALEGKLDDSFGSSRVLIWRETLALVPARPLLGGGPGSLISASPA